MPPVSFTWTLDRAELLHPHFVPRVRPQPIPESNIFDEPCVGLCMNSAWFSHVVGLLEVLRQRDAWQGTEEEVQAAIDQIDMLEASMSPCGSSCCGTTVRVLVEQYRWTLESAYDGTPRSVAPGAPLPDFGFNEEDPDPIDVARRHMALCRAVQRFTRTVFANLATAFERLGILAGVGTALLGAWIPVAAVIIGGPIEALILAAKESFEDLEAIDEVICCFYSHLVGLETTWENFAAGPGACGFSFPENRASLAGLLHSQLQTYMNYLVFLKVLDEEWQWCSGIDEPSVTCVCPGPCVQLFNFELYGRLGWYLLPGVPQGHWSEGVGWVADANDDGHYLVYVEHLCEPVAALASVNVSCTCQAAEGNMIWLAFYDADGDKVSESAKASVVGKTVYTFQANGISAAWVEVSQRTVPTAHTTPIIVHAVECIGV
jgi:hypothetical protein